MLKKLIDVLFFEEEIEYEREICGIFLLFKCEREAIKVRRRFTLRKILILPYITQKLTGKSSFNKKDHKIASKIGL